AFYILRLVHQHRRPVVKMQADIAPGRSISRQRPLLRRAPTRAGEEIGHQIGARTNQVHSETFVITGRQRSGPHRRTLRICAPSAEIEILSASSSSFTANPFSGHSTNTPP